MKYKFKVQKEMLTISLAKDNKCHGAKPQVSML